ncbi:hypothetical protein P9990_26860 (plasmid) [Prescottella equi]|uniref:hypothetical protein n=1 Tax=Rhodococcus hoagii TaxID=43767 RepID=UPI0025758549|nr:hypothetical protein [Prescottella equi]WJJ14433.1 hypothetical protein P9990_26860 [Prescottella equi]
MSPEEITDVIIAEIRSFNDWVSIADVLKALGNSSFAAGRDDVKQIFDCVNSSSRIKIGRVHSGYEEIRKPVPVDAMLDNIFSEDKASDRSALMMELFLAET